MSDAEELFPPITTEEKAPEEPVEAKPETEPKAEPKVEQQEQTVPLSALKAARGESRSLKQEIAEIKAMLLAKDQKPAPDPITDPEEHAAYIRQQIQAVRADAVAEISERMARSSLGDDFIDEAFEAAQAAGVIDQFRGKKDPWGDLAKWHKAETAKAEIGSDPEAYRAKVRAEILAETQAQAQATVASLKPPATLAGQPNLSSSTPAWAGPSTLDDILAKKDF